MSSTTHLRLLYAPASRRDAQELAERVTSAGYAIDTSLTLGPAQLVLLLADAAAGDDNATILELGRWIQRDVPVIPLIADGNGRKLANRFGLSPSIELESPLDRTLERLCLEFSRRGIPRKTPPALVASKSRARVFISYRSQDDGTASQVRAALESMGVEYWHYGQIERDYVGELRLELEKQLLESTALICVMTEAWATSKWCRREYDFCDGHQVPTIVLRVQKCSVPFGVDGRLLIDFEGDWRLRLRAALASLRRSPIS